MSKAVVGSSGNMGYEGELLMAVRYISSRMKIQGGTGESSKVGRVMISKNIL